MLYQAHLSEVFVPYMDPSAGWYFRTYMDSGEYGFGLFLSPLTAGVDCPGHASFLPAVVNDDFGGGRSRSRTRSACSSAPSAIRRGATSRCSPRAKRPSVPAEGRPATELVVRSASVVGNYDYLIDYRFRQNGSIVHR